jgi:H+-transporting ATP synthase F0 complex subunit s
MSLSYLYNCLSASRRKMGTSLFIPRRTFWMWLNFVFNRVDHSRVADVGPDRAAAEWILRLGGSVKFGSYESWTTDYNRMPAEPRERVRLEAINATGVSVTNNGLEHLVGLERLCRLDFSGCKYLGDDGLVHLVAVRDTLEELELCGCSSITHTGLHVLYSLHKLQYLGLRDTPGIRYREESLTALQRALPHCDIAS